MRSSLVVCLLAAPAAAQAPALLEAPLVIATDRQEIVATPDLDGDGFADAVGWWVDGPYGEHPGDGAMHGWINDRTGRLEPAWGVMYSADPSSAALNVPREVSAVADLDGDGREDWVLVTGKSLRVYRSMGASPPQLAVSHWGAFSYSALALADFDLDGALEAVTYDHSRFLRIHELDLVAGTATESSALQTWTDRHGPLVAAELTGDAAPDVLLSGALLFPVVGGALQPPSADHGLAGAPGIVAFMHDAGDVDGDGDVDVVTFLKVLDTGEGRVRVLRRTAPDTLVPEPLQEGAGPARILVDVDGDGDLDGVCCGGGGGNDASVNRSPSTFRLALNDGSGAFAPAMEWPGLGSRAIAGVEDLDGDGDLDLVGGRCVQYADGPWVRHPQPTVGDEPGRAPRLADVDCDGDPDVEPGVGETWWRNLGNAGLDPASSELPPGPGTRIGDGHLADWDGDGEVDLLVALGHGPAQVGLELLCNLGSGHFESLGVVDATQPGVYRGGSEEALPADLDGDGDLDLVLRTRPELATLQSDWWRNDGRYGFTWMATFPGVRVLAAADLDGDGLDDLLAADDAPGPLRVALNLGAGAFGPFAPVAETSLRPRLDTIVADDLDGDGDVDLALAHYGDVVRPRVYWNDGAGGFVHEQLPTPLLRSTNTPLVAQAVDLDGDGRLDLLFGPLLSGANAVALHLQGPADGAFERVEAYPLFRFVPDVVLAVTTFSAADLDGDGDLDLVGERRIDNQLHVLPSSGKRKQSGAGSVGTGGLAPLLGATGPFRVGETAILRLRGVAPGASGVVEVTLQGQPGAVLESLPFTATGRPGFQPGTGTWEHAFEVTTRLAGERRVYTAIVADPAGTATSNALVLDFGP